MKDREFAQLESIIQKEEDKIMKASLDNLVAIFPRVRKNYW